MNSVDLSWVLAVEIALPFIVLSIVLALAILKGRKKYKEAAKLLILSVKSSEDRDKQAVVEFQTSKLAIDETKAKKNAKRIMNERKFLIRNLISGLLDKNLDAISQLNQDLARVSEHYHKLEVSGVPQTETDNEEDVDESDDSSDAESTELKSEIKSLKQEVHITLTTLNNIFKEFSSMFGEDDIPDNQMTVDQIITAMESFSNKSPASNNSSSTETNSSEELAEIGTKLDSVEDTSANTESGEQPTGSIAETKEVNSDSEDTTSTESVDAGETLPDLSDDTQSTEEDSELDFSIDSAIDDIDSALDGLELDASDEEEPDWGDAFAESGDKMEGDPK